MPVLRCTTVGIAAILLYVYVQFHTTSIIISGSDSSIEGQLQAFQGQVELFKIQHRGHPPAEAALSEVPTGEETNPADVDHTDPRGNLGPYILSVPENLLNHQTAIGTAPSKEIGWVYKVSGDNFTLQVVDTTGAGVLQK